VQNLDQGFGALGAGVDKASRALDAFGPSLRERFNGLIDDAAQWGRDLIQEFINGLQSEAQGSLGNAVDQVRQKLQALSFDRRENDRMARRWGSDFVSEFSMGIRSGVTQSFDMPTIRTDSDDGPRRPATGGDDVQVFLDGKRVDKGTRRHRDRETSPRGRFGTGG